ncbi:MAG: adenylate/guanylate cyclase domain-containing protein [Rubrivivax sp.]
MAGPTSARVRILGLSLAVNFAGAALSFLYFRQLDTLATSSTPPLGWVESTVFVAGFGLLFTLLRGFSARWRRPLAQTAGAPPPGPEGDLVRRRALLFPAYLALLTWVGWWTAGLLWGALLPALTGTIPWRASLRVIFGIAVVGGTFVAAGTFFGIERLWRAELPRYFPDGNLSAVPVPRLRVRQRLLAVLLLVGSLPLAVLAVSALVRAGALLQADAATASDIVRNLIVVVAAIAAAGLAASVALAALVAESISGPLQDVQRAMARVREGELDTRCAVTSNDEIGAVAEGFNAMVEGLRERERIRETFGRYVSPEVRDEILAGRAAAAGQLREVTVLFADLRDFTPWVESSPAVEVVRDLNAYFSEMDAAIREHGGLVLQFIGDEIEAVFGAPAEHPRHADAAVAAARAMCERLAAWNERQAAAGRKTLRHGIGIHSGSVVAGNIGGGERLTYALVGDTVNVASRIQALNKTFGTTVLVSAATRARLAADPGLRPMPAANVKGVAEAVSVFSLA